MAMVRELVERFLPSTMIHIKRQPAGRAVSPLTTLLEMKERRATAYVSSGQAGAAPAVEAVLRSLGGAGDPIF